MYKKSVYNNTFDFPYYELQTGFEEQFKRGGYYANTEIEFTKMKEFLIKHEDEFSFLAKKFIEKMQ